MILSRSLSLAIVFFLSAILAGRAAQAQDAGSFTLKPGETRSLTIGFYREIRVCNNVGSGGTLDMTVGGRPSTSLAPGVCWREFGDSLVLANASNGAVDGIYTAYRGKPGRSGGGK